ncbi:hypothetical protein ABZX40_30520 [Streptomyces sp. NPDC004610]|uniref:hypothetical protein n=1 Tax=unclassified Streptomyces TaxID=2593676 RepID=UPI0033ACA4F5
MSVEHDGPDGLDGRDGRDGSEGSDGRDGRDGSRGAYDAPDPLLAVLMDEPPSAAARADAAFMAEYASARADVTALREQLGLIADALTEPEPAPAAEPVPEPAPRPDPVPEPPPLPRRGRRPFAVALGVLAVACAATLVAGLGWLVVRGGDSLGAADSSSGADQASGGEAKASTALGSPRHLACTVLVAEGEITAVRPLTGADGGRARITLDVTTYYKPAEGGERRITFERDEEALPPLVAGDHVLIATRVDGQDADLLAVGDPDVRREAALLAQSLPESTALPCG